MSPLELVLTACGFVGTIVAFLVAQKYMIVGRLDSLLRHGQRIETAIKETKEETQSQEVKFVDLLNEMKLSNERNKNSFDKLNSTLDRLNENLSSNTQAINSLIVSNGQEHLAIQSSFERLMDRLEK